MLNAFSLSSCSISQSCRNNMCHYHSDTCKTPGKKSDTKACRTRQPCSCLVSQRGRERRREGGRERETWGAGPTRWSSSQLHSREVTMASDKQSTIDHSSPRRRLGAGGSGRQETTEPTAYPSTILSRYIFTPLSFSFLFFYNLECH